MSGMKKFGNASEVMPISNDTTDRRKRTYLPLLILITLLCCGVPFVFYALYYLPMTIFDIQQRNTIPLYDALNEAVFAEMPPPPGVEQTRKATEGNNVGGSVLHGRKIYIHYRLIDASLQDVLTHYERLFTSMGWTNNSHGIDEHGGRFFHGTSCVSINTWDAITYKTYEVQIWHDFDKQPFSPPRPIFPVTWFDSDGGKERSAKMLYLYDALKGEFLTCP